MGWNERDVETLIDIRLANLGWESDSTKERNVFKQGVKTARQKRLLGGDRPDYVLYRKDSDTPLAIIEAKNPKKAKGTLDKALGQARAYAIALKENLILFAFDGVVLRACTIDGEEILINDAPLDNFLSEADLELSIQNPTRVIENEIIKNRDQMMDIFKEVGQDLRGAGKDAGLESLYTFCTFLFLKIKSEIREAPDEYDWTTLLHREGDDLLKQYEKITRYYKEKYKDVFRETNINNSKILGRIINRIKKLNLVDSSIDIKGEAYEYFLAKYSSGNKSVLGQYFTPRHIIRRMIQWLNPEIRKGKVPKIYDPFCGTGGMLTECYRHLNTSIKRDDSELHNSLRMETLFGGEHSHSVSQLAKMNMILIGDGHANIRHQDSLENKVEREYDIVITNFPFNMKSNGYGHLYGDPEADANEQCLYHCLYALKAGGRGAIVVPSNILDSTKYTRLRKRLIKMCRIEAILLLPAESFVKYTTARTAILIFSGAHTKHTDTVGYVKIQNDGFSLNKLREPIDKNDFPVILEQRDEIGRGRNSSLCAYFEPAMNSQHILKPKPKEHDTGDTLLLKDLVQIKSEKTPIDPTRYYREPQLSSLNNTISSSNKKTRFGRNIKEKEKVLIQKGDLVIGTLHTQQNNGLFAISDGEYIATSQIVCRIREDRVNKHYLILMLRQELPKLKKEDLVGRETYKPEEILNVRIPKPTPQYDRVLKLYEQKERLENEIRDELNSMI
ncbi:MAG: N-6 DNA methylase [Cytophagales bacterium]|nr:N-6 DNA methylase [Cytophagales bacterium]